MSKKRFKLSQMAHNRLVRFHERKEYVASKNKQWAKSQEHFVKRGYHVLVFNRQSKLGRKLTFEEKKKAYDETVKAFF